MKRKAVSIFLAIVFLFAAGGCAAKAPAATGAAGGSLSSDEKTIESYTKKLKSVPEVDFTLSDLNGRQWKLSSLKGKVVLLNFWATWCGPCQMEMPGFQKMFERFGENSDVIVLAVASTSLEGQSAQASKDSVSKFIKDQKFTFPVLFDEDGSVWGKYQQEGIPANYIIDKQGNVRMLVSGAFSSEDTMYAALEAVRRADSGK